MRSKLDISDEFRRVLLALKGSLGNAKHGPGMPGLSLP